MAKITTKTTNFKFDKTNSSGGTVSCNMCRGTGRLKSGYNKKKK